MIPGTGVGALLIQQSHLYGISLPLERYDIHRICRGTHETFSQSVDTLLKVPTNATGTNQMTIKATLPIQEVTYRKRVSYAPS